jgi:cytochrome c oxidase subunit II
VDENLHVPVDVPIRLVLTSEDVIHGFFIPAFRVKKDVVPGRYNTTWFRATTAGEYQLFCSLYCGTSHSDMLAKVVVHAPGGFERWLDEAGSFLTKLPPAEAGAKLFLARGCAQCHSVDGRTGVGPTLQRLFGSHVPIKNGDAATADENYIRESILEPQARIVAGFEPVMPTFKGKLQDREITAIIEYVKTLK